MSRGGPLEQLQEEFGLHDLAIEDAHTRTSDPRSKPTVTRSSLRAHCAGREATASSSAKPISSSASVIWSPCATGLRCRTRRRGEAASAVRPADVRAQLRALLGARFHRRQLHADRERVFVTTCSVLEEDIFDDTFKRETIRRLYDLKQELVTMRLAIGPLQDILNQLTRCIQACCVTRRARIFATSTIMPHASTNPPTPSRNADRRTQREPVAGHRGPGRGGQATGRLGRPACGSDPDASWYGMNFHHMPELDKPWGYGVIIGVTLSICGGLFWLLRRAKWL